MTFDGKVVLISGAARGQGRSHALGFAEQGADIIALDIATGIDSVPYPLSTADDLQETVRLVRACGREIVAVTADVRDPDQVDDAVAKGVAELGRVDVVLANAGVITYAPARTLTRAQWHDTIDVNLSGVWHLIQAAIGPMIDAQRGGSIIVTSSMAGLRGPANAISYVAAKHALVGIVRALANELGPHNIRVNSVHPTTVDTPMVTNTATYQLFRPDLAEPSRQDCLEGLSRMQSLPIPYIAPVDVTNAVRWLASDEARYVTGAHLPVDGGAANK